MTDTRDNTTTQEWGYSELDLPNFAAPLDFTDPLLAMDFTDPLLAMDALPDFTAPLDFTNRLLDVAELTRGKSRPKRPRKPKNGYSRKRDPRKSPAVRAAKRRAQVCRRLGSAEARTLTS